MMLRLGKKREELKIVKKSVNKERPKKEEPQKEKRKLGYVYFNRHFMWFYIF